MESNKGYAGKRILLAEDHDLLRETVEVILRNNFEGLDVHGVNCGESLVDEYTRNPLYWQLIVTDCNMYSLRGDDAIREIRRYESDNQIRRVPVVMHSMSRFNKRKRQNLDADSFVLKGDDEKLLREVRRYLL